MEYINLEQHIKASPIPISIQGIETILFQMKNCVCKIYVNKTKGTGFFSKIPYKNKLLPVLITNNHIFGENEIRNNKTITISLDNDNIIKNIEINNKRKIYSNEILDVTII